MSILYTGEIRSLPPNQLTDDKRHILLRPLEYCQEADVAEYSALQAFPIIPCNLCGSQEYLTRKRIMQLIDELAQDNPKIPSNMLHALQAVQPSQLMDMALWIFLVFVL